MLMVNYKKVGQRVFLTLKTTYVERDGVYSSLFCVTINSASLESNFKSA